MSMEKGDCVYVCLGVSVCVIVCVHVCGLYVGLWAIWTACEHVIRRDYMCVCGCVCDYTDM